MRATRHLRFAAAVVLAGGLTGFGLTACGTETESRPTSLPPVTQPPVTQTVPAPAPVTTAPANPKVTKANYQAINGNMKLANVERILGPHSSVAAKGYTWDGPHGSSITVVFDDDGYGIYKFGRGLE